MQTEVVIETQKHERVIEGFELSPQQRRLWALQQLGASLPYHTQCVVEISGSLDAGALVASVNDVVARHEILRTSVRQLPAMTIPVQVVTEGKADGMPEIDLTGLSPNDQEDRLSEWLTEARQSDARRSNERDTPVCRLQNALFALAQNRHALALSLPGFCADRVGLENLVDEIARGYGYVKAADVEAPTAEPLQYADLAAWQNEMAAAEESEPGRAYWRESLSSERGPTRLTWAGRARASQFVPYVLTAKVDAEASARLSALGARHDTSLQNLLLACFQLLIRRLNGPPDVLVGVRFAGRKYDELQDAIGPLARYLPVRCEVEDKLRFTDLLAGTTTAMETAARWQECFVWDLVGAEPENDGAPPFMPLCLDFADQAEARETAGVTFSIRREYECLDQFHAKFACRRHGDALCVELHYDSALLSVADAERFIEQFRTLLASVGQNPKAGVLELEIIGESERHRLLVEFNDTRADFGTSRTLPELFEAQVARTPAAVAAVFEDHQVTYVELNKRANQLARYLTELGVAPDVPVGLCLERSIEMLVGLLGVLKAGGAYVPLDPEYPRERLAFMTDDAAFPVLLTQQGLLSRQDDDWGLLSRLHERGARVFCLDSQWDEVADLSQENPSIGVAPDNLAYVIYTSGSTGRPKGAMNTQGAIFNRLCWMQDEYGLTPADRIMQKTPFSFDVSVWEFFWPLMQGASLVVARPGGHRDSAYLVELIKQEEITTLHFVPPMLEAFLTAEDVEQCRSLRRVICSGEALSRELQERFFRRLAQVELHNLYGPTEAAVDVTYWACDASSPHNTVPIGRPIANTQIYLLDQHQRLAPLGVAGELYIGGVQLARGYHQRPDLTAERFVPDPFSGEMGARLYRTGDLARYLSDGSIEYLGRLDFQVKLRGFRVEPGEIEATLAAHPEVREVVVTMREDRPGDRRLVAYVVAERGSKPAAETLRRFAGEKLPEFMIPWAFVVLEALPLAPNGKLDRRALPPPADDTGRAQAFVAPRDNLEAELAQLWEEILNVSSVGVTDNFFGLGGHSVLALRLVGQIHKRFGREVPLAAVIQAATIENLARMLREEPRVLPWDPLVTIQPEGTKTPFFAVHSIGGQVFCYVALAGHLGKEQPFYGLQAPRLENVGDTQVSIEDMAAHYVSAMREAHPTGPYQLGGYSFGVMVAFEMARQLRAQDQEVSVLALLDSPSPLELHKLPPYEDDDAFMFALTGKVAAHERGRNIDMTRQEFEGLDYEEMLTRFLKRMKDEDLYPPEYDIEFLRNFMRGYKTRQKAVRFYHPETYPGRITLFRAKETDPWLVEHLKKAGMNMTDPTLGWGALSTEPVEVHVIPGNHDRMCYEPHVRVLAKRLRQTIEKTSNGGQGRGLGWAEKFLRRG